MEPLLKPEWQYILLGIEKTLDKVSLVSTKRISIHSNILRIECLICELRLKQQLASSDFIQEQLYFRIRKFSEKVSDFIIFLLDEDFDPQLCSLLYDGIICLNRIIDSGFEIDLNSIKLLLKDCY